MLAFALAAVLATNPYLAESRALLEQQKYPEAEARLATALAVPNTSTEEKRELYELLARAQLAQGKADAAERSWATLLAADPEAPRPQGSPKIKDAFDRAKKSVYPADFVKLNRLPSAPGLLDFELVDPWAKVATVKLFAVKDDAQREVAFLRSGRKYEANVDGLRVFAQALDASGAVVTSLGTAKAPLDFAIAAPTSSITPGVEVPAGPRRWPAILAGVATVGAIAAGTVLAISAANDHGSVTDTTNARDTRALDAQARNKAIGANVAFGGAILGGAATAFLVWRW